MIRNNRNSQYIQPTKELLRSCDQRKPSSPPKKTQTFKTRCASFNHEVINVIKVINGPTRWRNLLLLEKSSCSYYWNNGKAFNICATLSKFMAIFSWFIKNLYYRYEKRKLSSRKNRSNYRRSSVKKVFLEISQNSQENTSKFCEIYKKIFFTEHLRANALGKIKLVWETSPRRHTFW